MAGVETAGLVLGAIPLITASLEAFQKGTPAFKNYGQARKEIKHIRNELETQKLILQNTLEVVLDQVVPASELQELLSDPRSSKWQSQELELGLRRELGDDYYKLFLSIVSRVFEALSQLEKSLQKLTADIKSSSWVASRRSLKWVISQRNTLGKLYEIEEENRKLQILFTGADLSKNVETQQVLQNLGGLLEKSLEVQEVAHNVEDVSYGRVGFAQSIDEDAESTYSIESEAESDGPSLIYLPLSVQSADDPHGTLKKEALLDTGATASAISVGIARELNLTLEKAEEKIVRTAGLDQDLPIQGKVRLSLRWKDEHGKPLGVKLWVFVVYGLARDILLSGEFTRNHPEVWNVAKTVATVAEEFNLAWFDRVSKEQEEAERAFRDKIARQNADRANTEKLDRESDRDRELGSSVASPPAGPLAPSTTGSTSGSTNGG